MTELNRIERKFKSGRKGKWRGGKGGEEEMAVSIDGNADNIDFDNHLLVDLAFQCSILLYLDPVLVPIEWILPPLEGRKDSAVAI